MAWGCLLPYDAARRHLATGHLQLPLQFGARRAPLSGAPLAAVLALTLTLTLTVTLTLT